MTKEQRAEHKQELAELESIKELLANVLRAAESVVTERQQSDAQSNQNLESKTNERYTNSVNYALKDKYWHTDLSKTQLKDVVDWLRRVGNPEATRITSTANWYKGRLNGNDLFVIYSTKNLDEPTILYERKGTGAKTELDILLNLLEEIENGESVDGKSAYVNWVSGGGWMQKVNHSQNNLGNVGRGQNNKNAGVLQSQSRSNGSGAFWSVLENLFEIQENINTKDSEGNTLSKEQQEYFKDSKVRNENGNLLVVYHGSASKFTVFSHDKINAHGNSHGRGFYFTEKKSLAEGYNKDGGQLLEGYLNITNPLSEEKVTIKKEDLLKPIEATCKEEAQRLVRDDGYDSIAEALPDTWISNYVDTYNTTLNDAYREVADIIYGNDNDVDIIAELTNAGAGTENVLRLTHDILGYDGVVYTASDGTHEFVSLVSEQFKNVDNPKPTNNPDTRFSLKDSDTNQKLESRVDEGYTDNADHALGEKDTIESIKGLILSINGKRGLKYDGGRVIRIPNNDMETLRHKFMTEHHYSNRSGGLIDCINCFGQGGKKLYFYVFYVGENNRVAPIFRLDYQYLEKYFDVVQKISDEMGYKKDEFIDAASGNGKGIDRIRNIAKGDSIYDVPVTKEGANNTSGEGYNNKGRGRTADNGRSSSGLSDEYDAQGNNGELTTNFSLKEIDDLSTKDQKELLDIIAHLKGEFEVTKFAKADPKQLAKMTRAILKDYSSRADYDTVFKAIDELYTYMANGENGESPVWTDVYNRAYNIAQEIVQNAVEVDDSIYNEYRGLQEYLRTTLMKFNPLRDNVLSEYENFNEFRKHNFGRLLFTKDCQDKVTRHVTLNF